MINIIMIQLNGNNACNCYVYNRGAKYERKLILQIRKRDFKTLSIGRGKWKSKGKT